MPTDSRVLRRSRLVFDLAQTADGRARLGRAVIKRVRGEHGEPRILLSSTTWTSKPNEATARWRSNQPRARIVYLESNDASVAPPKDDTRPPTDALAALEGALPGSPKVPLEWFYPPAVDAWNLAELLHSVSAPMTHTWARADQPALLIAIDPVGAGSILVARTWIDGQSIIVLTSASHVSESMTASLKYADAVLAHESLRADLDSIGHSHIDYFDSTDVLAALLQIAAADLSPIAPDPLISFDEGGLGGGAPPTAGDADAVVAVAGNIDLSDHDIAPRTFSALLERNVDGLEIRSARVSLLRRYRSLVERSDHDAFFTILLSGGHHIEFVEVDRPSGV